MFFDVNGFDASLKSGEDYDICNRLKSKGYSVWSYPNLSVVHLKNPKTIFEFIKRERWHGIGGVQNWKRNKLDKTIIGSIIFIFSIFVFCLGILFGNECVYVGIFLLLSLLLASSLHSLIKFKKYINLLYLSFLFGLFYIGRSMSFFDFLVSKFNEN